MREFSAPHFTITPTFYQKTSRSRLLIYAFFIGIMLFVQSCIVTRNRYKEFLMKLIFLGPRAARVRSPLSSQVCIESPHFHRRNIRAAIREKTPLGLKVQAIIDAGHSSRTISLLSLSANGSRKATQKTDFILDGFPGYPAAEALAGIITSTHRYFDIADSESWHAFRPSRMQVCSQNYNMIS
jgi:adenylate kinase